MNLKVPLYQLQSNKKWLNVMLIMCLLAAARSDLKQLNGFTEGDADDELCK